MKKILIALIIIILIAGLGYFAHIKIEESKPVTIQSNYSVFSLTFPGSLKVKEADKSKDSNYVLDVFSSKSKFILYSSIISASNLADTDINTAITAEKNDLTNVKKDAKNISEISKADIPNVESYKYSYEYYENDKLKTNLYSEVYWIKTSRYIYVLDFEIPLKSKNHYSKVFTEVANSFKELQGTYNVDISNTISQ